MLTFLILAACHVPGDETTLTGDLVMTDDNNYSYTGTLDVVSTDVESATDILVDWSALTTDLRGRAVTPAEVDQLLLIAFGPGQEEILAEISANQLKQSDVHDYRLFMNSAGVTSASLSEFSVLGNSFVPEDDLIERDDVGTWAIAVQDEVDGRDDILALAFLQPVVGAGVTDLVIDASSTTLDFDATLGDSLETAEDLDYTLDWSAVTKQAGGAAFDVLEADRLFIGHTSLTSDEEIEENFVQLLDTADELYRLEVYGETSADLSLAVDDAGTAFPGFSEGGSWIIGIECTTCTSPAPVLLSRVTLP